MAKVSPCDGFEITYVDEAGLERCEVLSRCRDVAFEQARPVRGFASFRGQSHFPGLWWFSSAGDHVGFESWLERDVVMLLDADPTVAAVVSQPFWLSWPGGGRRIRHAPDFFARLRDGGAVFASPLALMDGARAAGDPIAVLPALFGLLWRRRLLADLTTSLLEPGSLVWSPGSGR